MDARLRVLEVMIKLLEVAAHLEAAARTPLVRSTACMHHKAISTLANIYIYIYVYVFATCFTYIIYSPYVYIFMFCTYIYAYIEHIDTSSKYIFVSVWEHVYIHIYIYTHLGTILLQVTFLLFLLHICQVVENKMNREIQIIR